MEVYQWIFRRLGFKVSDTGYFVYANALRGKDKFDGKLEFDLIILPHKGDDSWVEPTILKIKETLDSDNLPLSSETCEYCEYRKLMTQEEIKIETFSVKVMKEVKGNIPAEASVRVLREELKS